MQQGVFFGVRSGVVAWQRHLDNLLGDDGLLLCSRGVFFGVHSGPVAWQRHLDNLKRFLWGPFWGCCWPAAQQWGGIFFGVRSEGI
jgi:hypothetical protein